MMRRRAVLMAPLALAGCGLATRPYAERRQWPLDIHRPQALPPRAGGKVLLVRGFVAGPGMEARGLQSVQADGSIRTEFYEEWSVPPAQGVEEAVRGWLEAAGLFAAVIGPGSRLAPDLVLEGALDALWCLPAERQARAALGITLVEDAGARLLLQRRLEGTAPLPGTTPPDEAAAMAAAVAALCAQVEDAVRMKSRA